jgi:hypothetical protein
MDFLGEEIVGEEGEKGAGLCLLAMRISSTLGKTAGTLG